MEIDDVAPLKKLRIALETKGKTRKSWYLEKVSYQSEAINHGWWGICVRKLNCNFVGMLSADLKTLPFISFT